MCGGLFLARALHTRAIQVPGVHLFTTTNYKASQYCKLDQPECGRWPAGQFSSAHTCPSPGTPAE